MSIYDELKLKKVINGCGKMTAIGVSKLSKNVSDTIYEAGQNFVVIDDFMEVVGKRIAELMETEAVCITSCASSGIAMSVAGIIAGDDVGRIESLPDSIGMKNKILIQRGHCIHFGTPITSMIKIGGGIPVEVGYSNETRITQLKSAIDENTAALFYVKSHHCVQKGMLSLEEIIEVGREKNLPVIVDAAAEEDFISYLKVGADVVIYSGAKALCAPASGIVAGKKEYIEKIKMQYMGIGRAMKVDKITIAGLLKAVENYFLRNEDKEREKQLYLADKLLAGLKEIDKLSASVVQDEAGRNIFRVQVKLNKELCKISGKEFVNLLKEGEIKIFTRAHYANLGIINFDMRALSEEDIVIIIERVKEILK